MDAQLEFVPDKSALYTRSKGLLEVEVDMNREMVLMEQEVLKTYLVIAATGSLSSRYNLLDLVVLAMPA